MVRFLHLDYVDCVVITLNVNETQYNKSMKYKDTAHCIFECGLRRTDLVSVISAELNMVTVGQADVVQVQHILECGLF